MKEMIKNVAWRTSVGILWYMAADYPFDKFPLWGQIASWAVVFVFLDLIRWGLKK